MGSLKQFLLQSLRVRVLLLLGVVVLPAFILMLWTNAQERRVASQAAEENALRAARVAAAHQRHLVDGARQLLTALSQVPEVTSEDPTACHRLLGRLVKEFPSYANIGVAAPDGTVWCSALPMHGRVSVADRSYFQRALGTRSFATGDYEVGRISGVPSLGFARPILDPHGRPRNVLFAALDLHWLDRTVAAMSLPVSSILLVLDPHGRVLAYYSSGGGDDRSVPDQPTLQQFASMNNAVTEHRSPDGVDRVYGIASLAESDVRVVLGVPKRAAFAQIDRLYRLNVVLMGLVVLLSALAAWFGGNIFVLRPVGALRRAASRLSNGELSARTGLRHGPGELNELARSFDEMAGSLQARAAEQTAIAHAAGAVVRELDLNAVARTVVRQAREALSADMAALWLVREDHQLEMSEQLGLPSQVAHAIAKLRVGDGSPAALAAKTGRTVVLNDALASDEFQDEKAMVQCGGARASLAQPLRYRDRLVGVLAICSRSPRVFNAQELRLVATLGDLFAAAVENARLYNEVREALRLREEFLAAAAHELRTPSTILASYSQLLAQRGPHDELERRWLAAVQDATQRAVRLSRELVEADRLARGHQQLSRSFFDLTALVHDRATSIRFGPAGRRIFVCATGPLPIEADRGQLSLALDALLQNSLKYQPAAKPLHVIVSGSDDEAVIEVQDSGPGIPSDRVGHVFEPLFEPWPPGSKHYIGVFGLGLHLARSIVKAHGGEMEVSSRVGQGSTFRIHLPLRAPEEAEAPVPSPAQEHVAEVPAQL